MKTFKYILCLLLCTCVILPLTACTTSVSPSPELPEINIPSDEHDPTNPPSDNSGQGDVNNTPQPTNNIYYIRSKVNGLSIRNKPSTNSSIVGSINKNDMLYLNETEGNWHKTLYKGNDAYITASSTYTETVKIQKASDKVEKVISVATKFLGTKYVYGATRLHNGKGVFLTGFTTNAFDCSSFVQYAYYYGANVLLNLTTRTQVTQGKLVEKISEMRRGDLMFFTNANRYNNVDIERIGHVAIFLGDNYILHTASDYAVIEPISTTRWNYLVTIRRHIA